MISSSQTLIGAPPRTMCRPSGRIFRDLQTRQLTTLLGTLQPIKLQRLEVPLLKDLNLAKTDYWLISLAASLAYVCSLKWILINQAYLFSCNTKFHYNKIKIEISYFKTNIIFLCNSLYILYFSVIHFDEDQLNSTPPYSHSNFM